MPEGPLGGPRPFATQEAELNIYFGMEHAPLSEETVQTVENAAEENAFISPPASGPHGESRNVVSVGVVGNSIDTTALRETKVSISNKTGLMVDLIEVIW